MMPIRLTGRPRAEVVQECATAFEAQIDTMVRSYGKHLLERDTPCDEIQRQLLELRAFLSVEYARGLQDLTARLDAWRDEPDRVR